VTKSINDKNINIVIKKITLPDGFKVGIKNLDGILEEVGILKLINMKAIKTGLVERAKVYNYIAPTAENEYAVALYREYQKKFEPDKVKEERKEIHQHTKG